MADDSAFVTLANVKTRMGGLTGSGDDGLLNGLIAHSAARISAYCHRVFTSQDYTEYLDGRGSEYLWLKAWPVTSPTGDYGVWEDGDRTFGSSTKLTVDTPGSSTDGDYLLDRDGNEEGFGALVRLGGVWPSGRGNVKVYYTAGYSAPGSIPAKVQEASYRLISLWYPIWKRGVGAHASSGLPGGGGSASFRELDMPKDVIELLHEYRREGM